MMRFFLSLRRFGWRRRVAFVALFALQGAIALSPLLDARDDKGIGMHIENRGTRHAYMHNEATCAVCSVRSLHSTVPFVAAPPATEMHHETVAATPQGEAPDRPDVGTRHSRAPPPVSLEFAAASGSGAPRARRRSAYVM